MKINNKILSAHQPNFLPWFGYFEKIIKSNTFVFSDDVIFVKQQLSNRINISNDNNKQFIITLPINRTKGKRLYEKFLSADAKLVKKSILKIKENYKKFKFSNEVNEICDLILDFYDKGLSLSAININIIKHICKNLDINNNFYLGSDLNLQKYSKNERLLKRSQILGIMTYLHGKGAGGYQDNKLLENGGLKLIEIDYEITKVIFNENHSLSIIHHIANLGLQEIKNRINSYKLKYMFVME